MRGDLMNKLEQNRTWRHLAFWVCWVVGFTFVKSFGGASEIYLGWFSYYLLTLPIFVAHTYLVAYVLIPYFLNKRWFPLFAVLFMAFFYGFSVLELIISNEFIFQWYPTGSAVTEHYLRPGNVVASGLGNLYIVLVFLAARTVRNWYHADNRRKELEQVELQQQMADAITRVQPMMLLYAIDNIDRMVDESSSEVTGAIALTSELLSEVMVYNEEDPKLFNREIELVRKLVRLVSVVRSCQPDVEFFISGDPGQITLPPMILFTLVDMIFRKFEKESALPELNIEASGYSDMITVQVMYSGTRKQDETLQDCLHTIQQLESYYNECVKITMETHAFGCSVIIRNNNEQDKAFHTRSEVIGPTQKVID
jgi:two-component system LytT family sensor kinase